MAPKQIPEQRALVLFSGGQDSTVCLAWALKKFEHVETVGFDYGQRHAVELESRLKVLKKIRSDFPLWAKRLGDDQVLNANVLKDINDTALTSDAQILFAESGLPNTFVPGRNILFFTLAAAVAYRRDIAHLVGGMCETDYSGYPDCRNETLQSLSKTLSLGIDRKFVIDTPLMRVDKAGTWKLAEELGGEKFVSLIIEETHTCYLGNRTDKHDWGYGCGECPSCILRARGYKHYKNT